MAILAFRARARVRATAVRGITSVLLGVIFVAIGDYPHRRPIRSAVARAASASARPCERSHAGAHSPPMCARERPHSAVSRR